MTEQDASMLLSAQCHIGGKAVDKNMTSYVYKRRADGINLINVSLYGCTETCWERRY